MRPRPETLVRVAAVAALLALGLMVWSLLDPRPVPIMVAMSLGQALGSLSLGLYAVVVIAEARRAARTPPPSAEPGPESDA